MNYMKEDVITECITWDAYAYYKEALMMKICPLINLIVYLAVQIDNRDHGNENKEILHCSWMSQILATATWSGEVTTAPGEVQEQLRLSPEKCRPHAASPSVVHLQPAQMSPLAGHHGMVLSSSQSSCMLCRIPAYQNPAQGILLTCWDETLIYSHSSHPRENPSKRNQTFSESGLIAGADCREELTQSYIVSMNTTSIILFLHMQIISFN